MTWYKMVRSFAALKVLFSCINLIWMYSRSFSQSTGSGRCLQEPSLNTQTTRRAIWCVIEHFCWDVIILYILIYIFTSLGPWILTYPPKIDGWFIEFHFLSKWSLFKGQISFIFGGGKRVNPEAGASGIESAAVAAAALNAALKVELRMLRG